MAERVRPVRVAIQLHPQHGAYADLRRAVERVEELRADLLYTWDHFFPLYGSRDGAHFECWTLLAAWAEQTETVELGPLVTCASYRNADLLADMARTLDHVSSGRFVLGLGSGWFERDYDEYGFRYGSARERAGVLADTLRRIRRRWGLLNPPPRRRIPIVVGGVGERFTLRVAAEHADVWHAMFPSHPGELEPKVEALERWCLEVGRDASAIERAVGVEPNDLERFLARDAQRYLELGFTQFTLGVNGPGWELGPEVAEWLAWRASARREPVST
ncbi:MAG TPA: LLM class F420-dependent oxidoreductase [Gaiellaceae bacterium]|nr:LLM class F420-dependent oxidoreductase [Gaiellaceae bacterium]